VTDLEPGGPYSPERTTEVAQMMADAVRYLNHATLSKDTGALEFPPDLDRMLAFLATMARRMPQLLEQCKGWLATQADLGRTEVTYGQYKGVPEIAAGIAATHFDAAAAKFADAARSLDHAHKITSAISGVDSDGTGR
jgi:hypothetical protein